MSYRGSFKILDILEYLFIAFIDITNKKGVCWCAMSDTNQILFQNSGHARIVNQETITLADMRK